MVRAGTGSALLNAMNAAVENLPGIKAPLLVIHGMGDIVVLPEASEMIRDNAGSSSLEYHAVENAFHDIFHEPEAQDVFGLIVSWLNKQVAS